MGGGGSQGSSTALNAANQQYGNANQALNVMNPIIQQLTSGGYSLPQINNSVFSYLMNPSGTNLAQVAPGLTSFYGNEMTNGLSPSVINNAMNTNQVNNQQNINSILNSLGPNTNAGSIANQLSLNSMMSNAQLGSNLAAQNQGVMQQGAAGIGTTASALDALNMQMMMSALQGAVGENTTGLSALQSIFGQSNSSGTSLTGEGAQLQDQEAAANDPWNMLGDIFGGAMTVGSMASQGVNPFSGLASMFSGSGGTSGGSLLSGSALPSMSNVSAPVMNFVPSPYSTLGY